MGVEGPIVPTNPASGLLTGFRILSSIFGNNNAHLRDGLSPEQKAQLRRAKDALSPVLNVSNTGILSTKPGINYSGPAKDLIGRYNQAVRQGAPQKAVNALSTLQGFANWYHINNPALANPPEPSDADIKNAGVRWLVNEAGYGRGQAKGAVGGLYNTFLGAGAPGGQNPDAFTRWLNRTTTNQPDRAVNANQAIDLISDQIDEAGIQGIPNHRLLKEAVEIWKDNENWTIDRIVNAAVRNLSDDGLPADGAFTPELKPQIRDVIDAMRDLPLFVNIPTYTVAGVRKWAANMARRLLNARPRDYPRGTREGLRGDFQAAAREVQRLKRLLDKWGGADTNDIAAANRALDRLASELRRAGIRFESGRGDEPDAPDDGPSPNDSSGGDARSAQAGPPKVNVQTVLGWLTDNQMNKVRNGQPVKFTREGIRYRVRNGKVQARYGNNWTTIGDVPGGGQGGQKPNQGGNQPAASGATIQGDQIILPNGKKVRNNKKNRRRFGL